MTYSVRNIAIALALAVAAAVAVVLYTSSYKDQVTRDQERVQVMVATQDIPAGTPGEQATGMMALKEVLRTDLTPGALTTTGGLEGKVTAQDVYAGQQVHTQVFQTPTTQAATLSLEGTERGVRVNVDVASGALGAVNTGDKVDVFASFKVESPADPSSTGIWFTRRLMSDVRVLEAPTTDPEEGPGKLSEDEKETDEQTLMLAVSQADVTKVAFVEALKKSGEAAVMWVVIRPPDGQAEEMAVTIEQLDSMLADGVPLAELKEKYGTYIDNRVKAQLEAAKLQDAAASGDAAAATDEPQLTTTPEEQNP